MAMAAAMATWFGRLPGRNVSPLYAGADVSLQPASNQTRLLEASIKLDDAVVNLRVGGRTLCKVKMQLRTRNRQGRPTSGYTGQTPPRSWLYHPQRL